MDKRFAMAIAAGTALALPLLAGCGTGTGTAPQATPSAPASSQAAPAPSTSPSASTADPTPASTPRADPAQDKKDVQAATEKFTKVVLNIGYPDKGYDDYLARIKPLMTKDGFHSVENDKSLKNQAKALKTLYAQKIRAYPDIVGDPKVSDLTSDSAAAKVTYRLETQQKSGDGWKTLDTRSKDSATVKLVLQDGKWLVNDAG